VHGLEELESGSRRRPRSMKRRDFGAAFAAAFLCATRLARAQKDAPHIAVLHLGVAGSDTESLKGIAAGLKELGYREGDNIVVDNRYAGGDPARLASLAAAAVAEHPDVIVAAGPIVIQAVAQLTKTIPIVGVTGDPVARGFAASLAHPGVNITGLAVQAGPELAGKWLQVLLEIVPRARRIALLYQVYQAGSVSGAEIAHIRDAASRVAADFVFDEHRVRDANEIPAALEAIKWAKLDGLIVGNDPLFLGQPATEIAALGVPAISGSREFAEAGFLATYGASISDVYRRAVGYVDRILKGANPAEMPIEQPTKFDLVINLKTAKALGLVVPQILLAEADKVIE
jgi:putative tryptophan/tyrosine transport system substrate-binding protein